jgi:hypothetical protein
MSQVAPTDAQGCINHPDRTTRVRCSSCERPICPRCMRESAVGMKCPDCARQPRRAVRPGSPGRYAAAAAAGVGTAALIGALIVVGGIGVFGILVPLIAGFAVGEVVSRMAHRLGGTGFQLIAAASTAVGLALGAVLVGRVPAMLASGPMVVFILIASAVAAVRVGR